jgi:hypothetical protein
MSSLAHCGSLTTDARSHAPQRERRYIPCHRSGKSEGSDFSGPTFGVKPLWATVGTTPEKKAGQMRDFGGGVLTKKYQTRMNSRESY